MTRNGFPRIDVKGGAIFCGKPLDGNALAKQFAVAVEKRMHLALSTLNPNFNLTPNPRRLDSQFQNPVKLSRTFGRRGSAALPSMMGRALLPQRPISNIFG